MESALVSVCIPAYNNEDTIIETIQSVLAQTYHHLELIVVDDGSTDETYALVEQFLNDTQDDRLRLYRNEKNLGMAGNWNRCMELCEGAYIKLLCADDLIHESLLSREVAIMERYPEVSLVQTDTRFVDMHGKTTGFYKRYHAHGVVDGKKACRFSVFTRDYLGAPLANLIRRSAYETWGGFDPSFVYMIDYDFFMRICCKSKIYILHEPLNSFRIRNDSNTSQVMTGDKKSVYLSEHRRLVERYALELHLSRFEVNVSVAIRHLMSFMGGIYLKLFVR